MAVVECTFPVFALHALWPQDHEQLGRMLEGMVDSEVGTTDSTELNLQVQSVPPHGGGHTHTHVNVYCRGRSPPQSRLPDRHFAGFPGYAM